MQSLFNPADRESLSVRLATLEPGAMRRWGKMDPAQMLSHCGVGLEVVTGGQAVKQVFLGRLFTPFIRGRVLGEEPFGKNLPTDPTFVVSDKRNFEEERARLATQIDRFVQRGPDSAGKQTHPFFGRLSGDEWGRLMYKHLDHHLRQFGV
jgi:hypothetical protein